MKILILGANGFLGQALQKKLRSENIDFFTSDKRGECDFLGDLTNKKFVMDLPDINILINCAAVQYVTPKKPLLFKNKFFFKNNVISLRNLFSRYGELPEFRFIHIGTSMMYEQNGSARYYTDSILKASGIYSETKVLGQEIVNKFKKNTTIVPCIIAGEGRGGLFKNFVLTMRYLKLALLIGSGEHKISIVHVNDVASLIARVIKKPYCGILNVAAIESMNIKDWIEIIAKELDIKKFTTIKIPLIIVRIISKASNYNLLAKEQLSMLEMAHVLDIEASTKLGWAPKYSSEDIIRETAKSYSKK